MAEFEKVDPKDLGYFLVGLFPDRQRALIFSDYLNSKGIRALAQPTLSQAWAVYVDNELNLSRAKLEYLRFANNPFPKEFNKASWQRGATLKKDKVLKGFNVGIWDPLAVISITEIIALIVFLGGFLSYGFYNFSLDYLSFISFSQVSQDFEVWRLITPIFLHFGFLHIAFNIVMFEALGRPAERVLGKKRMLYLVLVIALVSNIVQLGFNQAFSAIPSYFGGLSGVVYGLIGYLGVLSTRPYLPQGLMIPRGLMTVCLIFIIFGFFLSGIANFCHLGGLFTGALLGLIDKKKLKF